MKLSKADVALAIQSARRIAEFISAKHLPVDNHFPHQL